MKAQVLQRKCYLLDKQEVGWEHVIPKVTLFDSIHNASPAPSEGKLRKQQTVLFSPAPTPSHPRYVLGL